MMKEGGFGEAFATFDVIFKKNKKLVTTSAFVGLTTWLMLSSFNHIAERNNPDMIWIVSSRGVLEHSRILLDYSRALDGVQSTGEEYITGVQSTGAQYNTGVQ